MPGVIAHGPARLGKLRRGCAQCHLPMAKAVLRTRSRVACPCRTSFVRLTISAAGCGTQPIRQGEYQHDDRAREGDD